MLPNIIATDCIVFPMIHLNTKHARRGDEGRGRFDNQITLNASFKKILAKIQHFMSITSHA